MAWITVHGRTTKQRGEPANWDTIRLVLSRNKYECVLTLMGIQSGFR